MARENAFVTARDGTRLAVTLYLPEAGGPWPAILEALPYRKDDVTGPYYREEYERLAAEFGYAVCRLDVRGTGSSEGIPVDEYTAQEHEDIETVIAWLAGREWCTGSVGMYGTSWSGFNSLQVAMRRPPALKAICSIFASDDRYGDDVHYFGGVLKQLDLVDYPTYMEAMNVLPPVPSVFGEGWREEWARRFESYEPWSIRWLEHQTYDDYWKHGSLREDYGSIEAATMLVAGWADGYTNIALRGFAALRCPRRVLAGPWAHASIETSLPGPNIDIVPEMVRWWDRYLKGRDNGVDRDPPIVLFVRRPTTPSAVLSAYRGEWRFEAGWPLDRSGELRLELSKAEREGPDELAVRGDVGWTAWISCAGGLPWGQPQDQRPDEAYSLVYDWEPLEDELEILGHPVLHATVRSSAEVASLSAKLCDVHPDGTSQLVTRGLLNLTHRNSREAPTPLTPGEPTTVTIELEVTSWVFEAGHRVRLDLAGTDWPNAWPPPGPVTLAIERDGSALILPTLEGPAPVAQRPALPPPRKPQAVGESARGDELQEVEWRVEHDVLGRETRAIARYGGPSSGDDVVPALDQRYGGTVGVSIDDPGRAWVEAAATYRLEFPEATVSARARSSIRSDRDAYEVRIEIEAAEEGLPSRQRTFARRIPRRLQ
ncbi:MAG TPA: CocE/NonD family hydrolase [Actinomycetota bacterium]|nr:CocE/NonD family hydrolase [Actinomycetota bacterium]